MKVYLDTQDFINLYKAKSGTEQHFYRSNILKLTDENRITIPITATILSEFLQPTDQEHFQDRIERAKFLNRISKGHCLPYYTDLVAQKNLSGDKGWMPVDSLEQFNFTNLLRKMRQLLRNREGLSRHYRR